MTDQKKGRFRLIIVIGGLVIIGVLGVVSSKAKPQNTPTISTTTPTKGTSLTIELTSIPTENTALITQNKIVTPSMTSTLSNQEITVNSATPSPSPVGFTNTPPIIPTGLPTIIPNTSTPAVPCNQASNPVDETVPAGSQVIAGQSFIKIWSVQNTGSCTWRADYRLVLAAGTLIYPSQSIQLGESVSPGTVWPISIDVTAPVVPGSYYDTWKLYTNTGQPVLDQYGMELEFPISVMVVPATAQINGRITIDGLAASAGVNLSLEDAYNQTIATSMTSPDGTFSFSGIPALGDGYYVIFSEAANSQYRMDQVVSWAWIGPIATQGGDVIQLSDIDISRLGFGQISPAPEAVYSSASLSFDNPILFTWADYPDAIDYWVDLVRGEEEKVWQSQLVSALSTPFDGTLSDGSPIQPDEYWWAVGARRWLGAYPQAVYTYLTGISVEE